MAPPTGDDEKEEEEVSLFKKPRLGGFAKLSGLATALGLFLLLFLLTFSLRRGAKVASGEEEANGRYCA